MQKDWKRWFIEGSEPEGIYDWEDRKYGYRNIHCDSVPFHGELKDYIFSLSEVTKGTTYEIYHVHLWEEGGFFSPHKDNNFGRKWSWVCELQESQCGTTLLVEGKELKEGIFDSNTIHEVPKIQKGKRISLTVFGLPLNTLI